MTRHHYTVTLSTTIYVDVDVETEEPLSGADEIEVMDILDDAKEAVRDAVNDLKSYSFEVERLRED